MDISKNCAILSRVNTKPLRFLTCGNVDDGKSTLIGRLLWDTNSVPSDHMYDIIANPVQLKNGDTQPDFSRLLDGLEAEREQGITIDVAYRYFSTEKRSFIVADTPGHEQYTRNMFTGASTADLAVLLIDAQSGITEQTKRHALIATKLGIKQLVLVVNKMDLVSYSSPTFHDIAKSFDELSASLGIKVHHAIPISAVYGFNVTKREAANMNWYRGPCLLECLEASVVSGSKTQDFRMSIQRVSRPSENFRGYQGTITNGSIAIGQKVIVLPSSQTAEIKSIMTFDGDLDIAHEGDAVTVALTRDVDAASGDLIAAIERQPLLDDTFDSELFVLNDKPLSRHKRYWLKSQSRWNRVKIFGSHQMDLKTGQWEETQELNSNSAVRAWLRLEEPAMFDLFSTSQSNGSFILVDPDTYATVAGGMIVKPDATNRPVMSSFDVDRLLLSMPSDLVHEILLLDQISDRLSEIEVLETQSSSARPLLSLRLANDVIS